MRYPTSPLKKLSNDPSVCISLICSSNFTKEVLQANKTVLLMCMHRNESFSKQIEVIGFVSDTHAGQVKVCLLVEEFIPQFCQEYKIKGTPTFLFFAGGVETDRILGCIDRKTVSKYLARNLGH